MERRSLLREQAMAPDTISSAIRVRVALLAATVSILFPGR